MKNERDRMRRATWRPISEETRAAHLASIEAAIESGPLPDRPVARTRRRISVIAVAAALFILPAGIAVAAEGSIPGDALYPVKKFTETIRALVDDDVVAEHRIEELEKLVAADAPPEAITKQLDRAAVEVDRLEADNDLRSRFDVATDRVADSPLPDPDVVTAEPPTDRPPPVTDTTTLTTDTTKPTTDTTRPSTETTTVTRLPPDRVTTTTTVRDGTTTTVPPETDTFRVVGVVRAGPTCPVAQFPPDPACEDQPVNGAVVVVATEDGAELTRIESNAEGFFHLRLPAGTYLLIPKPYDGLLGTADSQIFVVGDAPVELLVGYDTGIR